MPIRSRSHELEDESFRRFYDALPAKWVPRRKERDYGIDCEVELFDPNGSATGLTFLVQLRATDSYERADAVRLELDELAYYRQLDLPVMVVRYCSATQALYWQWSTIIGARSKLKPEQISFTYRFREEERWSDETPRAIRRTLDVRRALAAYPAGAPVRLRIDFTLASPGQRLTLEQSLNSVIADSHGTLIRAHGEPQLVEVALTLKSGFLALRIDTVTSATFDLPDAEPEIIVTSALYGLVRLLRHNNVHRQAEAVAQLLVRTGRGHFNDELAMQACEAVEADLPAFAQLAILNGFHNQASVYYGVVALKIARSPQRLAERKRALDLFFEAALALARETGGATEGAAHYSIANFVRQHDTPARAMHHYNQARRLRPAYWGSAYFLRELGGVLFGAGRFTKAAAAYEAAAALEPDSELSFLLGDALLHSGEIARALAAFKDAATGLPAGRMLQETELKTICCQWLTERGSGVVPTRRTEAYLVMTSDGKDTDDRLRDVLANIDGLNPLARFNLGVRCSRAANHEEALVNFLLCAFVQSNDAGAWVNAAICGFGLQADEIVLAVLAVAIHHAGPNAYAQLRDDLVRQNASEVALEALDFVAAEILAEEGRGRDEGFTLRMLDGDKFMEMTVSGDG